jgi:hypothetical protein
MQNKHQIFSLLNDSILTRLAVIRL